MIAELESLTIPNSARVPHLDQYFGVWAIHEAVFRAGVQKAASLDIEVHLKNELAGAKAAAAEQRLYSVERGVAIIPLQGALMKHASSFSSNSSTVLARRKIRQAIADDGVGSILLAIDSPGGTVAGTRDLADEVARATKSKPVFAYVEDLGASAAYWIASQADKIFANPTALVGSIGTYGVLEDSSGAAQQQGVTVHVVRAGAFKGVGEEGTPVTLEHLAEYQRIVNQLNDHFVRDVAGGRKMTLAKTRELADGRVHVGQDAVDNGMIDAIQSLEETLTQLSKKGRTMSVVPQDVVVTTAAAPASYDELVAGCVGADADFIVAQLAGKHPLATAQAAWMVEQNRRVQAARQEAEAAKAAVAKPGHKPVESGVATPTIADAKAEWDAAIAAELKAGKSRRDAVSSVAKARPDLQQALIAQANQK